MLLDHNKFVVKSQSKMFSSKKSYQILDEEGQTLATAKDTTGFFASLFGSAVLEVRDASNDRPLFTVGRTGWLLKKDQLLDAEGQLVGRLSGNSPAGLSLPGAVALGRECGRARTAAACRTLPAPGRTPGHGR